MLNKVFIQGRLTKDPELRRTNTGTPVCSITLAVERDGKDANGNKVCDFIDVVAWKAQSEFIAKFFAKGRTAIIVGPLQIREWTDRDGNKRRNPEVIARDIYFGDSKPAGARTYDGAAGFEEIEDISGELPF